MGAVATDGSLVERIERASTELATAMAARSPSAARHVRRSGAVREPPAREPDRGVVRSDRNVRASDTSHGRHTGERRAVRVESSHEVVDAPVTTRLRAGHGQLAASLALGLVGALVASCGSTATVSSVPVPSFPSIAAPTATPAPTVSSAVASAIPAATPTPTATAGPMVTAPPVARVTLSRLGTIPSPSGVSVMSFVGGYVAFGTVDDTRSVATWFSADGRSWKRTIHSTTIIPCPGWSARSDLDAVYVGAAVDGKVVIIAALAVRARAFRTEQD